MMNIRSSFSNPVIFFLSFITKFIHLLFSAFSKQKKPIDISSSLFGRHPCHELPILNWQVKIIYFFCLSASYVFSEIIPYKKYGFQLISEWYLKLFFLIFLEKMLLYSLSIHYFLFLSRVFLIFLTFFTLQKNCKLYQIFLKYGIARLQVSHFYPRNP